MTQHRTAAIVSAVLAGLCPLIGNGLYAGPGEKGQEILAELESGLPTVAWAAYPLEIIGFLALTVFLGTLVVRLLTVSPVAAVTTGIAGATMLAVKLGSISPGMALRLHHEDVTPATVELVAAVGDEAFIVSAFLLAFALAAAGIGLLRTQSPRWLAWWPIVAGGLGVLAGIVGIVRPEAFVPVPFLLLLVWMVVLALHTALSPANRGIATSAEVAAGE